MLHYVPLGWTHRLSLWADLRGRACRPNGKGSGEEGILSDMAYRQPTNMQPSTIIYR